MKRTTNVDYKATASAKGRAIVHTAQYASERVLYGHHQMTMWCARECVLTDFDQKQNGKNVIYFICVLAINLRSQCDACTEKIIECAFSYF